MTYLSSLYTAEFHILLRTPFEELSLPRQVLCSIHELEIDVYNGGFSQYVTNSSGGQFDAAIDSLQRIGAARWADIAERARRIVFQREVPHDRRLRQTRIAQLTTDEKQELDRLSSEFRDRYREIFPLLTDFARAHARAFSVIPVTYEELPERLRRSTVPVQTPLMTEPMNVWPHREFETVLTEATRLGLACISVSFFVVLADIHAHVSGRPEPSVDRLAGEAWSEYSIRCTRQVVKELRQALVEMTLEDSIWLFPKLVARRKQGVDLRDHLCVSANFIRDVPAG